MTAAEAARASALARLRQVYCPPAGESRLQADDDDDDDGWPVSDAYEISCGDATRQADSGTEESLESEWDAVTARTDFLRIEHKANLGKIQPKEDPSSLLITYKEVQAWVSQMCAGAEVLQPLENRASEDSRSGGLLQKRLKSEVPRRGKDLVLHLRATPFDFNTSAHFRMLRTVYTKLTLNKWCPSIGSHWEVLGFQAGDPRTDLNRSGGVLNVLHLFFFLAHHFELASAGFQLSQDEYQNFPLACISINITSMVIESLCAGRLSALCSKESGDLGVLEVTCKMHSAGLAYFCSRWRSQKRTIEHTEQTLNELKLLLDRKPAKLFEGLKQGAVGGCRSKKAATALAMPEFADLEAIEGAVKAPLRQSRGLWARSKAAVIPKRLRRYQDENINA